MLSPSAVSATTPEGSHLHPTSSRRRALSYLRNLSQTRSASAATSPTAAEPPRISPRSYFNRSISYTEPRTPPPTSNSHAGRRSTSRTREPNSPPADETPAISAAGSNTPSLTEPIRSSEPTSTENSEGQATTADSAVDTMARSRQTSRRQTSNSQAEPQETDPTRQRPSRQQSGRSVASEAEPDAKAAPLTIRFYPHHEVRPNGRQSLNFTPISRSLPVEQSIIRVGRYSEREGVPPANPTAPSDAPVGFKSKVVSRKHCEFSNVDGQWYVKDVASSSGTFLNHIRLSQPNTESRPFPVKDGDIVQLGIDFRGGEEMIFRCVKIRIECNRSWQKKPNDFNKSRHRQLQMLAKDQQATTSTNNNECSICLGSVLPCQSLFVAPCAHVWHYKCIRPMLEGRNSTYPQFQCPNCRAYSDLTADVDIAESDMDEWMENTADEKKDDAATSDENNENPDHTIMDTSVVITPPAADEGSNGNMNSPNLLARRQASNPSSPQLHSVNGISIPGSRTSELNHARLDANSTDRTATPDGIIMGEGPLTPRNNAGPFVFDGGAGRDPTEASLDGVGGDRMAISIPEIANGGLNGH